MSEEKKRKGFFIIPRIVRLKYRDLTHGEKWLYACLCDLCGEGGTCFRSLRTLEEETGIAFGSLKPMILHLQEAGLIEAVKKRRPGGTREIWHITIVDIWKENAEYLAKSQDQEQTNEEDEQPETPSSNVRNSHINVGKSHTDVQKSHEDPAQCVNSTRQCVKNLTEREEMNKTSELNKNNGMREREQPTASQGEHTPSITLTDKGSSFLERYRRQKYTVKPKSITEKVIEQANTLGEEITSDEDLLSLYEYTHKKIENLDDPTVFLGNLVKHLPGWIQQRDSERSNPFRSKPQPTEEKPAEFIDELMRELAKEWHEPELLEELIVQVKDIYQRAGDISEAGFEAAAREMKEDMENMKRETISQWGHKSLSAYFVWSLSRG